jgi:site-specific DNA-methyltransferase (adenine-specific)
VPASPPPTPYVRLVHGEGLPVTLYEADCLEAMPRLLPPGSVDVVVTSPPYNLGMAYGRYRDRRPREEYLRWIGRVGAEVDRVLSEDGSFFLNVGGPPKDPWLAWDVARQVGLHLTLQNVLHWVKSIVIDRESAGRSVGLDRDLALGHYKPVSSPRYVHSAHEYVFHFSHRGDVPLDRLAVGAPYQDKSNVHRWKGTARDRRCRGNTWFLPYPTIQRRVKDRPHPAAFPPELPERCLRLHGLPKVRLALDPFLGIGSSALAAARLGVPFLGIDLDPEYLDVAVERLVAGGCRVEGVARPTPSPPRPRPRSPTIK